MFASDAVESAEAVSGLGDQRGDGVLVPEVELDRKQPIGCFRCLLAGPRELLGVGTGCGHSGSFGQQSPYGDRADARSAAGDDEDLVLEPFHCWAHPFGL
jgi:hypothetical protein